jgi:quinoprotein dehydrogenase-associated probable ABC transporter substrate-binding protein
LEEPVPTGKAILRIAADPNNLPFSNERLEGFENKIAEVLGRELNVDIQYTWRAQRRGFFRETLKSGECDVVLGVPSDFEMVLPTRPYYRSSYVFVYRQDRPWAVRSLDDPVLERLKIGVQLVGDNGINTPPAHALAHRGIVDNVLGYSLYGDYAQENPPARIMDAVARGAIDIAVVWGPLAGYFAKRESTPLQCSVVLPEQDGALRFAFDISMGVRKGNRALRDRLDDVLLRRRTEIDAILDRYNVPRVTPVEPGARRPPPRPAPPALGPSSVSTTRSDQEIRPP